MTGAKLQARYDAIVGSNLAIKAGRLDPMDAGEHYRALYGEMAALVKSALTYIDKLERDTIQ